MNNKFTASIFMCVHACVKELLESGRRHGVRLENLTPHSPAPKAHRWGHPSLSPITQLLNLAHLGVKTKVCKALIRDTEHQRCSSCEHLNITRQRLQDRLIGGLVTAKRTSHPRLRYKDIWHCHQVLGGSFRWLHEEEKHLAPTHAGKSASMQTDLKPETELTFVLELCLLANVFSVTTQAVTEGQTCSLQTERQPAVIETYDGILMKENRSYLQHIK